MLSYLMTQVLSVISYPHLRDIYSLCRWATAEAYIKSGLWVPSRRLSPD